MTIHELHNTYLPRLAPEDFFVLLAHVTQRTKAFLLAHPEYTLSTEEEARTISALKRRLKHEPVAYIVGHKEFYGREFHVTADTLIPRPETELMIESVLNVIANTQFSVQTDSLPTFQNISIVDIGTGSGNIIITLAKEIEKTNLTSNIQYCALDISSNALAVAVSNATYHRVTKKIIFLKSNLLERFVSSQKKNYHLIITANLPYLSTALYHSTEPNVKNYEPRSALESGRDGLDHYRRLIRELKNLTLPSVVTLFLEISPEQTQPLATDMLTVFPNATVNVLRDLSGKNRLIQACIISNTKTP